MKLVGALQFTGKTDNMVFYYLNGQIVGRAIGYIHPKLFTESENYENLRHSQSEFSALSSATTLIRNTFIRELAGRKLPENRLQDRMMSFASDILKTDITHPHGERRIQQGDMSLWKGFNFNIHAPLKDILLYPWSFKADAATGLYEIAIPSVKLKAPAAATHFEITLIGALLDFPNKKAFKQTETSGKLPLTKKLKDIHLSLCLKPESPLVPMVCLGISFYQQTTQGFTMIRTQESITMEVIA